MFVITADVPPTIGPAGLVMNAVEGCVPVTQTGHDLIQKYDWWGRSGCGLEVRFHATPKEGPRQAPLINVLLQALLKLQSPGDEMHRGERSRECNDSETCAKVRG